MQTHRKGSEANVEAAQKELMIRAKANSEAQLGIYSGRQKFREWKTNQPERRGNCGNKISENGKPTSPERRGKIHELKVILAEKEAEIRAEGTRVMKQQAEVGTFKDDDGMEGKNC